MSTSPEHLAHCQNCGSALAGPYCAHCGQRNVRARLDTRSSLREGIEHALALDSALGRTLRRAAWDPGGLADEYAAGHRARYVNPFKLCLAAVALYFLFNRLVGFDPMSTVGFRVQVAEGQQALADEVHALVGGHLSNLMFVVLPLLALALRTLFRSRGRNYAECVAFVLFLKAQGYLYQCVFSAWALREPELALQLRFLFLYAWMAWGSARFFGTGLWSTLWRTAVAFLAFALSTALLVGLVALPIAYWKSGAPLGGAG